MSRCTELAGRLGDLAKMPLLCRTSRHAKPACGQPAGATSWHGEKLDCDTRSHVVSELVKEVWLMPGT